MVSFISYSIIRWKTKLLLVHVVKIDVLVEIALLALQLKKIIVHVVQNDVLAETANVVSKSFILIVGHA